MSTYHIGGGTGASGGDRLGILTEGLGYPLREVSAAGVVTLGVTATADAGDSTVAGDVNATNFTSQIGTTSLFVTSAMVVTIAHKGVAYLYQGPRNVALGVGGDYVTTAADYTALGTNDHDLLTNRNASDQHAQSAITGLLADQAQQDQNLVDHETDPDPHMQYTLESEAEARYVYAGYGGIQVDIQQAALDILANSWITITAWDTPTLSTPRGVVQDVINDGLRVSRAGLWLTAMRLSVQHDPVNAGRVMTVRLNNVTKNLPGRTYFIPTGRNNEGTNVIMPGFLLDVAPSAVNDLFQVQLGGLDGYTNIVILDGHFELTYVGTAI